MGLRVDRMGCTAFRVYGQDPDAWADRWGLEPFLYPCDYCGRELRTSVPFVAGQFRGLEAPPCECGSVDTPYCVVRDPKHGDMFTGGQSA